MGPTDVNSIAIVETQRGVDRMVPGPFIRDAMQAWSKWLPSVRAPQERRIDVGSVKRTAPREGTVRSAVFKRRRGVSAEINSN
jgi:hypothetical protein